MILSNWCVVTQFYYKIFAMDTLFYYCNFILQRAKKNKLLYKKRQEIIEHPFGTIKWVWGFNRYQTRGKEKVDAENAFIFTAYNMRRAINIVGVKKLIEAIKAKHLCLYLFSAKITPMLRYLFTIPEQNRYVAAF